MIIGIRYLLPFLLILSAVAKDVTITWDPNTPTPASYTLFWGTNGTRNYSNSITTTNVIVTLSNQPVGVYWTAVTANDTNGLRSDYSDEISFAVNQKPGGIKVKLTLQSSPVPGQPWTEVTNVVTEVAAADVKQFYRGTLDIAVTSTE